MAYIELVRVDEPQRLYCATFFLGKAGNVVPGGYWDTVEEAMHNLVHVMETRDVRDYAPLVDSMTAGVIQKMAENPTLTWSRFEVPETATGEVAAAIPGMTAGCSVQRNEEYSNYG
ncbi:MAG: hypothetical protein KY468_03560 [Armatimonadetes bacterium]|nr:hypothetical protein [Armatimonadota bacterium]